MIIIYYNEINNIKNKIENILNVYEKINFYGINIIYNINKEEDIIYIFGEQFVENNLDICQILYENNYYELTESFATKDLNID